MTEELKKVECDPKCGFMVRSHDEKELIDIVCKHAKNSHPDFKVTEEDIRSKIQNA